MGARAQLQTLRKSASLCASACLAACCFTGCTGPFLSERIGLKPLSMHPPYKLRVAAYKLDRSLPQPGASGTLAASRPPSQRRPKRQPQRARPRIRGRRRGGLVSVPSRDLQQVHDYFGERNPQWILADTVDVIASVEFFSQILTINTVDSDSGDIHRTDRSVGGDKVTVMRFTGAKGTEHALVNPRIFIGGGERALYVPGASPGGLTITARKTLRLRMAKTKDASKPVRLRVLARGGARRGRGDDVAIRSEQVELRGDLIYDRSRGRWVWRAN